MNKQDVIAKIVKDTGITKTAAAAAVDSLFDSLTKALKKGDSITFVGFGTFKTVQRKAAPRAIRRRARRSRSRSARWCGSRRARRSRPPSSKSVPPEAETARVVCGARRRHPRCSPRSPATSVARPVPRGPDGLPASRLAPVALTASPATVILVVRAWAEPIDEGA
jgi:nucleoid DNA-binding protein